MNLQIFTRRINSLQKKLILALGMTVFIPLLLMSILYYYDTVKLLKNSASQNIKNAALLTAQDLDIFINGNINGIWSQAQLTDIIRYIPASSPERKYLEAKVSNTFKSLGRLSSPFVQSFFILDKNGNEIFNNSSSDLMTDRSREDYFRNTMASGHPETFLGFNPAARPLIYFVAPVRNPAGHITGVTGVKYDLEIVQNTIVHYNNLAGPNSFAIVLDQNDRCVASGMMPTLISQHINPLSRKMEVSVDTSYQLGKDIYSATQIPLSSAQWKIIFVQPNEVFMRPIKKNILLVAVLILIIFSAALLVSFIVGTLLANPIKNLTKTSQEIISGNLNARAKIFSSDETGLLASAFNQMTEKLQNEIKEVSESEIKFRTLVDNIQGVIYRGKNDPRRPFLYCSNYLQDLSGYSVADFGKRGTRHYADIIHPQDLPEVNNTIQKALKAHQFFNIEYRICNQKGNIRWVSETGRGIYNKTDQLEWIDGVIFDISERKQAEYTLLLIKKAVESSSEAIEISDPQAHHFYQNKAFTELFEYTLEELDAMGGGSAIYANKDIARNVFDLIMNGKSWSGELEMISKSGRKIPIILRADAIKDEAEKIVGLIGVHTDITERKRSEELLKKSESQYHLLANHMKDQVWLMDLDLKVTYISPSVEKVLEYNMDELTQLPLDKLLTPASFKAAMDFFSIEMPKALASSPTYSLKTPLELEFRCKDGHTVWGESMFSFIRDDNGKPLSILGEARDITERKQAEDKLQQTIESLKRAVGATIQVMVSAVEIRDPYTAGHQLRSANLACAIATEMGLSQDKIEGLQMAGSIHDIGKLSIPAEILSKPTKLTDIEFSLIKEHSQKGYEILKDVESPWPLAQIVYQHHERMNGSGYPRNLKGDEILMDARIMAVADVVEAMASHRPYRSALGIKAALEEIEKNKGILYDAAVVDACLKLFREKGYQIIETLF